MSALQRFLLDPANHDLLAILKGARNGLVYGCKIRFPHALVMTFLFSHKPLPAKIRGIFTATKTHALNLCKFVTIYKTLLLLQKKLNGGKERNLDTLVAGGLGGYWVFGDRTPVRIFRTTPTPSLIPGRSTSKLSSTSSAATYSPYSPVYTLSQHLPLTPSSPCLTLSHLSPHQRATLNPSRRRRFRSRS
ncbi:hypothetical protein, variant [Cryptococcus amylolentus CBS 6039]|uniref:Peroxisomal membrane protein 4 n=1 Tax=Cryptococcus amylolentus CBS 6039 TaxID=1295533 RepID=A0A1E3H941_9TREE|nr:hypothetical protein, variant [Cryptococcus amylolentus CBS 6039]ODN72840.1 hypothetical protein, variant [Cryptococcus amylolentus CBS 6039]